MVIAAGAAVAASILLGMAFVLQQRAAERTSGRHGFSPRLLLDLVVKPIWVTGIALMVGGQLLGAAALGLADMSAVEPVLSTNLLVALAVAWWLSGQPWVLRDVKAAVALTLGVVGFVLAAQPGPSAAHATSGRSVGYLAVVAMAASACVLVGRRASGRRRAVAFSAAAGLLFGLQDGLTRQLLAQVAQRGLVAMLVSWAGYAVLATAVVGLLLTQNAFQAAPLVASLPPMTVAEPLIGIGYGVGVFHEPLRLDPAWLACEAAALMIMMAGLVSVSRSPLLTRAQDRGRQPDV